LPGSGWNACRCNKSYQAQVWSRRDKKVIKRTFPTLAAAKGWRSDATKDLRGGRMRAPTPETLREAGDAWLEGAKAGAIRTRSGDTYKPSAIRSYEGALTTRIYPELGANKLSEIQRRDVQELADRLLAGGLTRAPFATS
jgi:integrase